MKMTFRHIIPMLVAATMLGACSSDAGNETDMMSGNTPILLRGEIDDNAEANTRAATDLYNSFAGTEEIDVTIYNADNNNAIIGQENMVYTITSAGVMTPPTGLEPFFPATTSGNVKIRAVYPSGTLSRTVLANQESKDNYEAGELLWAGRTATRTNSAVELIFQHRMAKIIVNLTSRNGSPNLPGTVTLKSFQPTATVSKESGEVTPSGTAIDIVMTANGAAMVPPQTHSATPIFEIATAQGDLATYTPPSALVFKAGYVYTYDVQVDMRVITVTSTISTWGDNTATYTDQNLVGDT